MIKKKHLPPQKTLNAFPNYQIISTDSTVPVSKQKEIFISTCNFC